MKIQPKKDIKENLIAGLVIGLVTGLLYGLVTGLVIGLVTGLLYGLVIGLVTGLVIGLVTGLVYGLVAGLVTQIIAYFNNPLLFSAFYFWGCLIGLIIIQTIGWILVYKLKEEDISE